MAHRWNAVVRIAARRAAHAPGLQLHPRRFSSVLSTAAPLAQQAPSSYALHTDERAAPSSSTSSWSATDPLPVSMATEVELAASEPTNEVLLAKLAAPSSFYRDALAAYEQLHARGVALREFYYVALMEKANVEHKYSAVGPLFGQFCTALDANRVITRPSCKNKMDYHTIERVQMHRHVLWAMLNGKRANRVKKMQAFYHDHVQTKPNRANVSESDSLNFLLRMECTYKLAAATAEDDRDAWLTRIHTILREMRKVKFRTSYSSSHALFHFLMARPEFAIAATTAPATEETQNLIQNQTQPQTQMPSFSDDDAIKFALSDLMKQYPHALEPDPRRMSLAVSTAASAGRVSLAILLLQEANHHKIPIDAASFAHAVESAKDNETRQQIADLFMRAEANQCLYEDKDNDSMKNYLLLYAIHDGNFTQIMELLHEMEYSKVSASASVVKEVLTSFAGYRAVLHRQELAKQTQNRNQIPNQKKSCTSHTKNNSIAKKLTKKWFSNNQENPSLSCPTVLQLVQDFPHVFPRNAHTFSHAVLQGLRAGDIDEAIQVLRLAAATADGNNKPTPLRAEVFSNVVYALLASESFLDRDVLAVREIETLYDTQHPGERAHLISQLLNLCESSGDLVTMVAVLDRASQATTDDGALSRRAATRVFDTISKQLQQVRAHKEEQEEEEEDDEKGVRYVVAGVNTELSFRSMLDKYPLLFPLDAWTVSNAVVRSATSRLVEDVITLLQLAQSKALTLEHSAYKSAMGVLLDAAESSSSSSNSDVAQIALYELLRGMKANGAWQILQERDPEMAARATASQ